MNDEGLASSTDVSTEAGLIGDSIIVLAMLSMQLGLFFSVPSPVRVPQFGVARDYETFTVARRSEEI